MERRRLETSQESQIILVRNNKLGCLVAGRWWNGIVWIAGSFDPSFIIFKAIILS